MNKKGRVARTALLQEANRIIRMAPTDADREAIQKERYEMLEQVEKSL